MRSAVQTLRGRSCSPTALRPGVLLKAAKLNADGAGWVKLVLVRR